MERRRRRAYLGAIRSWEGTARFARDHDDRTLLKIGLQRRDALAGGASATAVNVAAMIDDAEGLATPEEHGGLTAIVVTTLCPELFDRIAT